MSVDIESIKKSYGRCLVSRGGKKQFFVHFYDYLLKSDPAIKTMFATRIPDMDLSKQIRLLQHAVNMIIMYADSKDSMAGDVLKKIRETHSSAELNVNKDHYALWEDSFIETLQEHDPEFNDGLAQEWHLLIRETVVYLLDSD